MTAAVSLTRTYDPGAPSSALWPHHDFPPDIVVTEHPGWEENPGEYMARKFVVVVAGRPLDLDFTMAEPCFEQGMPAIRLCTHAQVVAFTTAPDGLDTVIDGKPLPLMAPHPTTRSGGGGWHFSFTLMADRVRWVRAASLTRGRGDEVLLDIDASYRTP